MGDEFHLNNFLYCSQTNSYWKHFLEISSSKLEHNLFRFLAWIWFFLCIFHDKFV